MDRYSISPPHSLNILYFKILGFWQIETESKILNKIQITFGRTAIAIFTIFVVTLFVNIIQKDDLQAKTTLLPVALSYCMGVMKLSSIVKYRGRIYDLIKRASLWEINILNGHISHMKHLIRTHRKQSVIMIYSYSIHIICLLSIFAIQPYIENNYMNECKRNESSVQCASIFDAWVPWDKTSPTNYNLTYVYELTMLIFGSMQQSSYDTLILALLMFVILRIRVLKYKLSNLTERGEHRGERSSIMRIIDAYQDFQTVIRFIKDLDSVISGVMFAYFFIASLVICCTVYQVSLMDDNNAVAMVKMLSFTIVLLMQLYLLFWYGNQVTVEISQLVNASYECEWYKEDVKFQKSFLLIRNGFHREYAFNIANFSKISLRTFLGILKTTYSVYTVMRQTQSAGAGGQENTPTN